MTKSIGSLLALAVTTSIALANGGEGDKKGNNNPYQSGSVSWKPGSGVTLADTEEFKLVLSGQLQVGWGFDALDNAADAQGFDVRRARIDFSGHVWSSDVMYKLKLDAVDDGDGGIFGSQDGPVKDAWAQWRFYKSDDYSIGLRAGQGKTHHGLESTGTSKGLFFVDRSSTSRTFAVERTRGAWLHGAFSENKIRWVAGAQNGDVAGGANVAEVGEETSNVDNALTYVASVSFDPMNDVTGGKGNEGWYQGDLGDVKDVMGTIGAGIEFGNNRDTGNNFDIESMQFNVNTAWAFGGGLTAQGEVFIRTDDPDVGADEDTTGWYAQGTYTLPKSGDSPIQWGFGLRVNMIDSDDTLNFMNIRGLGAPGDVTEVSGVVDAFYHGHACKTQFEYTWQDANPDVGASSTNHLLRIQFQVLF